MLRRWPRSSPTSPRPRWRRRWRSPAPSCRTPTPACRLAVIGMGKCGGRELNYVSDVDVIYVAEPAPPAASERDAAAEPPRRRRAGRRRPAGRGPGSRLLGATAEGTLWPVDAGLRPEGRHGPLVRTAGQPRQLLRALGQDLGVPGAAQGPAGRRGRRPRPRSTSTAVARWSGRRRERDELRRRRPGHAPPGRAARPAQGRRPAAQARRRRPARRRVQRPAAAAGARPHRRAAARRQHPGGAGGAGHLRLRRPRRRRRARPRLPVPAHRWSTGSSCTGCAAPTSCPGTRTTCAGSGVRFGLRRATRRRSCSERWQQQPGWSAGCTRSCSTGRCWTRPRGCPPTRPGSTPEAAQRPAGGAGLPRPGRRAAAPRGAHLRGQPPGGDPAHPAAGDARLVRRRRRPRRRPARLPPAVRRARHHPLVPADAARLRGRRGADGARAVLRPAGRGAAAARPGGGRDVRRRRAADAARPRGDPGLGRGSPRPGAGRPRPRSPWPPARSAAGSWSAPRSPTWSG